MPTDFSAIPDGIRIFRDLTYSRPDGMELCLDLYLPGSSTKPVPVILWAIGGGWRECAYSWAPAFMATHGFALASLRYRVSSEAIALANVFDCKAAVRWLRANSSNYGLASESIGIWGSSAGGHLAALVGVSKEIRELEGDDGNGDFSSAVQAVCNFCGPTDLARIAEIRATHELLYDVTSQYLGGPVEENLERARLVSPITYASASCPPMLIIHGDADDVVPVEESVRLYEKLKTTDVDVTLKILPCAPHGWDWELSNELVITFFKRTLM